MKKSRLAILIVAIIVICASIGVSFAAYISSSTKDSITIGSGESIGISVDIGEGKMFQGENGAKLVPQGALVLHNGIEYLNERVSATGQLNTIALVGRFTLKVEGSIVSALKFSIGDIMCGNIPLNDIIEINVLQGYSAAFDKYNFVKNNNLPTDRENNPHYLGATWENNQYVGGSRNDIQTAKPLPIGKYEFLIVVSFKIDANSENMPNNISNSPIKFDLNIDALQ